MIYSKIILEQLNNSFSKKWYIFKLCSKIKYKPNLSFFFPSFLPVPFFPINWVIKFISQICSSSLSYDKFRLFLFPTRFTAISLNMPISSVPFFQFILSLATKFIYLKHKSDYATSLFKIFPWLNIAFKIKHKTCKLCVLPAFSCIA